MFFVAGGTVLMRRDDAYPEGAPQRAVGRPSTRFARPGLPGASHEGVPALSAVEGRPRVKWSRGDSNPRAVTVSETLLRV